MGGAQHLRTVSVACGPCSARCLTIYLSVYRWGNRGRRFKRGARELKGANKKLEPADLKPDGHGASHRRSSWTGMTLGVKPRLAREPALIVTLALALTFENA